MDRDRARVEEGFLAYSSTSWVSGVSSSLKVCRLALRVFEMLLGEGCANIPCPGAGPQGLKVTTESSLILPGRPVVSHTWASLTEMSMGCPEGPNELSLTLVLPPHHPRHTALSLVAVLLLRASMCG